jgi:Flp pilus assembly protein TadD
MTVPLNLACLVCLVLPDFTGTLPIPDSPDGTLLVCLFRPGAEESASSSGLPAAPGDDAVARAAAAIEAGQLDLAAALLDQFVHDHPEQILVRAQYAELLFRLGKNFAAKLHFEMFIALAQEHGDVAFRYLLHSHSRLVALAEADHNAYAEHLHRGLGLYLLACRRSAEEQPEGGLTAAALFCRAAAELQKARAERPDEARPYLYLYAVWLRLGQPAAASAALRQADQLAALSFLTPRERRQLLEAMLVHATTRRGW